MTDLSDWSAKEPVGRKVFEGRFVRLEPLDADVHGRELFLASSMSDVDDRFRYLAEEPPTDFDSFRLWLEKAQASEDPLYFAVIDKASGKVVGRQTFMRTNAAHGVTEIGNIYWSALIARTPATTEACYLFANYVFEELHYRRFEWKCNNDNEPSKRAAIRYGFKAEGVHRQSKNCKTSELGSQQKTKVCLPKPVPTFGRHALACQSRSSGYRASPCRR